MEDVEDDLQDVEGGSDTEKVDSSLIRRILSQMKSEFNKPGSSLNDTSQDEGDEDRPKFQVRLLEESEEDEEEMGTEDEKDEANHKGEEEEKDVKHPVVEEPAPRPEEQEMNQEEEVPVKCKVEPKEDEEPLVPAKDCEEPEEKQDEEEKPDEEEEDGEEPKTSWRSRRTRSGNREQLEPKRSSRRMSKDLHESVLQSAIILKEKSFGTFNENKKRRRRSRREIEAEKPSSPSPPKPTKAVLARYSEPAENPNTAKVAPLKMKRLSAESGSEEASTSRKELKLYIKSSDKVVENDIFGKNCGKLILCHSDSNSRDSPTLVRPPPMEMNALAGLKRKLQLDDNPSDPGEQDKRPRSFYVVQEAAEASEPPQVPDIVMEGASCLCDCQKDWGLYPSQESMTSPSFHCRAMDSFDERVIGCANPVDQNSPFLRPGKSIPHSVLCQVHVQRLIRHNSCPTCGLFCTQGEFMQCPQNHQFHKLCSSASCPHCGSEELHGVRISLGEHRCPVFLPKPNTPALRTARMSFSKGAPRTEDEDSPKDLNDSITLPGGEVISSRGIPLVEKEKLDKVLQTYSSSAASNDSSQRYTWRTAYQAAKAGDSEKLLQILGSGFSPSMMSKEGASNSPIHVAASNGHLGVLHILVQVGVNLDLRDKEQLTPLMAASLEKQNEVVKYLVKAGAQVSLKGGDGMTALHIAAKDGNLETCHYLVANLSCPEDLINTVDEGRWTALVWAAENSHDHVVRFLLERNADPQIRDRDRNTALHWAAYSGSSDVAEFLLNYGASINLTNAKGDTPLHIAARQGADECVFLLLARGARTDMMNKDGHLPRDVVISKENYSYAAIDLNMKLKQAISNSEPAPRVVSNDVTKGYEPNPIQCVNGVDDDGAPEDFVYVPENCITTKISIDRRISNLTCCKCEDDCSSLLCMCGKVSIRSWYDAQGKLLPEFNFEDPPMIFECNPTCKCTLTGCRNRVVQRGIKARLQLFKTKEKNWGVHSLTKIPKGSYVCEYVGEIISDSEADTREDDSYLFDLDSRDGESYCIDARKYGNITRFINHCCTPNLLPVRVFIEHQDLHFPRIAFFANRDIPPYEELSFDYGEKFWIIKYKSFTCKCGIKTCKYSDETIQETLEKYREKTLKEEQEEESGEGIGAF